MSSLVKYSCVYFVHLTVCTSNYPLFLTSLLGKKKLSRLEENHFVKHANPHIIHFKIFKSRTFQYKV